LGKGAATETRLLSWNGNTTAAGRGARRALHTQVTRPGGLAGLRVALASAREARAIARLRCARALPAGDTQPIRPQSRRSLGPMRAGNDADVVRPRPDCRALARRAAYQRSARPGAESALDHSQRRARDADRDAFRGSRPTPTARRSRMQTFRRREAGPSARRRPFASIPRHGGRPQLSSMRRAGSRSGGVHGGEA
jgi:hypothetical protein